MAKQKTWSYFYNYALSSGTVATNQKQFYWLISRGLMGDTGAGAALNWKDESNATVTPSSVGTCWGMLQSCNGAGNVAGTNFGASTTVNGSQTIQTHSGSTISLTVTSTSGFANATGTIVVIQSNIPYLCDYTGVSGSTLTGVRLKTGYPSNITVSTEAVIDNRDFYGTTSTSDTTFSSTNIVGATAGSNHSWAVWYYYNPSGSFAGTGSSAAVYFLVDNNTASLQNNGASTGAMQLAKVAPAAATAATAAPTFTTSVSLATAATQWIIGNSNGNTFHVSGILSTDGIFRMWMSRDGDGYFSTEITIDGFADIVYASDAFPFCFSASGLSGAPTGTSWIGGKNQSGAASATGAANTTNGCYRSLDPVNATTSVNLTMTLPCWFDTSVSATAQSAAAIGEKTGTNFATGNWDQVPWCGLMSVTPGFWGMRGRLYDTWFWAGCRADDAKSIGIQDATFDSTNKLMVVGDEGQPCVVQHTL